MSYTDELGRKVNIQDREQVDASQKGLKAARERKEQADYDQALKEHNAEQAQYEKDLAAYEADQKKLAEILKDPKDQEAKKNIDTASDRHGAVFNYRDTDYVKDYLKLDVTSPTADAYRKANTNTSGTFVGSGSELNRALNFDKHTWLGGSVEQWKEIIAREDADRELSQFQSRYLRSEGNRQIQQSQQEELSRLGSTGPLNTQGPTMISETLTKGRDRVTRPDIPIAPGYAKPSQPDFSFGYTEESKAMGFIASSDIPFLKEKNTPKSFEQRSVNVLSMSQQAEKGSIVNTVKAQQEEFHIGNEKQYFFDGKEVKDKSAQRLIDFQQGLKTTKRPNATIYRGILEQEGLPVTPLAIKIIDTLSSKGTFLGFSEPQYAYGEKPTYTNPITGESFDAETKIGSPVIAKQLGYVYDQNMQRPEIKKLGIGDANIPYSFSDIETVRAPIGNLEFILKTNQLTPNPKSKEYVPQLQAPQGLKPSSSSGQRFEFLLSNIEKEQLRVAKYDDDVGKMYHAGLEFSKDLIAGGAFIENLIWDADALALGKERKTRPIEIPHTMFTTGLEQVTERKPEMIIPSMMAYEKKYGKGSGLGAAGSLLLPIPGSEVKLAEIPAKLRSAVPQSVKVPIGVLAEKIRYPVFKNKLDNIVWNLEERKNLRTVQKYAISRQSEGVFGIERVNPKLFIITRGLEESSVKVRGYAEKQMIGFTKKDNVISPIYSKTPQKQIFPRPQVNEPVAELSIIQFQKKKPTLVTDIFKPDRPVTPVSQRIVVSSLDPEFFRTAKTLGLSSVKQTTYDLKNPTTKQTMETFKLEKEGQLELVAIGQTARLKDVKELSKFEKLFRVKQSPFSFIGSKAQITRFYETPGMGLGKGKGFIERIKSPDFISVGSKDMDRAMERAGLAPKRDIEPFKTPFDVSDYKTVGSGQGKATALSALTKKNVKMSFGEQTAKKMSDDEMKITGKMSDYEKKQYYKRIAKERRSVLDRSFPNVIQPLEIKSQPTDYLSVESNFKPKYEYKSGDVVEFESLRFPEIQKPVIEIKLNSLVSTKQSTRQTVRTETKQNTRQVQKVQPLQIQRPKLDNALVTRQQIRERQVVKQSPRLAIRQIEIPMLKIKSMQTPKLRERQLMKTPQLLKQKQIFRTRTPDTTKTRPPRRPVIVPWWDDKTKKKKGKQEGSEINFFLGNVPESQISGIFRRREITLGKEKIEKTRRGDVRVLAGKKRNVSKKKTQEDILGFKKGKQDLLKIKKGKFW